MVFMITRRATFLMAENTTLLRDVYLSFVAFCGLDAINNVYDVDLDVKSAPLISEYTKNLARLHLRF